MPECPSCRPELYEGDDPLPHIRSLDDWAAAVSRIDQHNPTEPTHPYADADPPEPGLSEPDLDQPVDPPTESGQIWTDLDNPEPQNHKSPVPDSEFTPTPRNSRPKPKIPSPNRPRADDPFAITNIGTITITINGPGFYPSFSQH